VPNNSSANKAYNGHGRQKVQTYGIFLLILNLTTTSKNGTKHLMTFSHLQGESPTSLSYRKPLRMLFSIQLCSRISTLI